MVAVSAETVRPEEEARYFRIALLAGLALTAVRLLWIAAGTTDFYPDEAQYWLWAQTPDWGYFSKPPLVAWIIRATTAILGDGMLGIRAAAPLLHLATSWLIFATAARLFDARLACWASLAYLTAPGVSFSSVIMSTDVPLLACWAASLYGFVRAREPGGRAWWLLVGAACGLGLLAKYAMAYWMISALLYVAALRDERRHLPWLLGAYLLALAIYSPNYAWNHAHDFASYRHTEANAALGHNLVHPDHLAEFFLSQFGVFGPVLFAALIAVALTARRSLADRRALMLATFALPTLGMMLIVAFLSRAHPNWSAPTYVSSAILATGFLLRARRRGLLALSFALGLLAATYAYAYPPPSWTKAHGVELPSWTDPWNRLRGWRELGDKVGALLATRPGVTLMGEDRETLAALAYYVHPHPPDMVKWNPSRRIADHFALTTDAERRRGGDFLFVSESEDVSSTLPFFADVREVAALRIPRGGGRFRSYWVFEMRGFKGYRP